MKKWLLFSLLLVSVKSFSRGPTTSTLSQIYQDSLIGCIWDLKEAKPFTKTGEACTIGARYLFMKNLEAVKYECINGEWTMQKLKYSKEIVDDKIFFYLLADGKRVADIYLEVQVINGRARLSEFNTKTMSCNQYTITAKLNGTATKK